MKNLKKVLALVVALTMVLGTVGFAAYTDVAEDAGEYTAVSTLSSLGILTGYEDGTFKPDGDITRAEFSAVVCRALGAKVSGTAATPFTDVAADHWASGYIAYVAGQKIVNGMGDGTFAPDANVTVEQAVKMLVVALGFEPMAAQRGGYPTGYMVVANTYGITEGIAAAQTANASRAIVSQLVYNALDVPMMEQTGFGTQIEYTIQDGTNDKEYKTLLTGLDVAKLDGVVIGTPIIEGVVDNDTYKSEVGKVWYKYHEAYDNIDFEAELEDKDYVIDEFFVAEGVDAAAYYGVASTIYVSELSKNKYEIIAIMPGEDSTIMEFGLEDLTLNEDGAIEYYTSANKYDSKVIRLVETPSVVKNYVGWSLEGLITSITNYEDEDSEDDEDFADYEITFIENTGDNKFDMIIAKEYSYARVEEVEADKDRFTASGDTFSFDFEDYEKSVSIVDKNGDAIELADFAEDDVIAYIADEGDTKYTQYDWIEIINLGQNAVTGTVIEENGKNAVYIDGTEYGLAVEGVAELGDEGTFYLTRTGKIFDSEKDASVSGNYAYILATALDTGDGFSEAWQVKMLTKEGEVVTYSVRDGFSIGGVEGTIDEDEKDTSKVALLDTFKVSKNVDIKDKADERIVTYKLDSKGKIREINPVEAEDFTDEYEADAQYLAADLEDDTVIFNVSANTETGIYTTGISGLVNENEYSGWYIMNDKDEVDCVVITEGGSKIDVLQDLAIVASVTDITVDEGATKAKKVRYYTSNEEELKEITIVEDEEVSFPEWETTYGDVSVGDAMMFTDDGNGTASAYAVIFNANTNGAAYTANTAAIKAIKAEDDDVSFVTGYIDTYSKVSGNTKIVTGAGDNLVIKSTTNTYTIYNKSESKLRVYVDEWDAVNIDKAEKDNGKVTCNAFVAKKTKSTVTDFITYSEKLTLTEAEFKAKNDYYAESDGDDTESESGSTTTDPESGSDATDPESGSDATDPESGSDATDPESGSDAQ